MKLVDTDIHHREDDDERPVAMPPRPEHRRVYTSLLVTFGVLVATVAIVFLVFPKRNNEMLSLVFAAHERPDTLELTRPTHDELAAWSLGVIGRKVPWPDHPGLEVVGARALRIFRRPAALVRYRAGDDHVSLVALRPREAVRRKHWMQTETLYGRTWRRGKVEFAIVGPLATRDRWRRSFDVP
jgi:hypothetical protein